jgi:hypothetical protein
LKWQLYERRPAKAESSSRDMQRDIPCLIGAADDGCELAPLLTLWRVFKARNFFATTRAASHAQARHRPISRIAEVTGYRLWSPIACLWQ